MQRGSVNGPPSDMQPLRLTDVVFFLLVRKTGVKICPLLTFFEFIMFTFLTLVAQSGIRRLAG